MMRYFLSGPFLIFCLSVPAVGGLSFQKDIDVVVKQGRGTPEGRVAWDRLSNAKAEVLPALLEAMDTKDTVAVNWLRLAFDQIVEREMKAGGKSIDSAKVRAFVMDASKHGRARRYALDLLDRLTPGTSAKLYPDWLDDPEFRHEAIALVLEKAQRTAKQGNSLIAVNLYRQAFDKSRDLQQARDAAAGLADNNVKVSVAEHLGFLMAWHLIGPFDGQGQKGFHLSYPPEKKIDLTEELDGQNGKIRWKRYQVKETSKGRHQALVDLREKTALGNADDAVAFAFTEFTVEKAVKAEMRGSADDNLTVWVNGA